ncbi:MBL fold metallo-hydrolase [Polaribacter aquimarinus]|uniref:Pyrroloquinoline quinone biosynthesis protein PqqB n=1 Tax=Polaribacter aquimarinus TaxID=2100726 RepID=A0A2U2JES2_9FLAO|nr:MBL fold metallo-hydrolase [Polaribacter aquimarinus]PWG06815.1 pyrroloquinoline quinone biosynthesis protein PqqB [Polaribacter aquimarinus]
MKYFWNIIFTILLFSCNNNLSDKKLTKQSQPKHYLTVLGTAQDGGYPHIGCQKICCANYYNGTNKRKSVVSLGLVDLENNQKWLFDATPDMHTQLAELEKNHLKNKKVIDGVFLTHAHIGHYTGLMYFGREALGKKNINIFAMPKMKKYLTKNGPWSQLISLENIKLQPLQHDSIIILNNKLTVTPFFVPHRDEFSETVGYKIKGSKKSALFIPDIDKWQKWKRNIIDEVKKVDYAFVDATFLNQKEVKRAMTEVPHPFIEETIKLFQNQTFTTKNKVIFIHFNHTNPVLQENSEVRTEIEKLGFRFASEGQNYGL